MMAVPANPEFSVAKATKFISHTCHISSTGWQAVKVLMLYSTPSLRSQDDSGSTVFLLYHVEHVTSGYCERGKKGGTSSYNFFILKVMQVTSFTDH